MTHKVTIRAKLLLFITAILLLVAIASLYLAHSNLSRVVDESQQELYYSKIDMIINSIKKTNTQLEKTGLVDAYRRDFQRRLTLELSGTYYRTQIRLFFLRPITAVPFSVQGIYA